MKKSLLFMIILFLVIFSGCSNQRYILEQDDISVNKSIIKLPDEQLEVKVNWSLIPEVRVNNPTDLFYPPYLVIVPPDARDWYHDNNSTDWMYFLRSLPNDVIENTLNKIPDYQWEKNRKMHFGWEVSAKSFEQGTVKIIFKKAKEQVTMQTFKIYFVYYDPIVKKGWVKTI